MIQIKAADFKAKCLKLMDLVEEKHETINITKRGIPIAKLVPYRQDPQNLFGFMKSSIVIKKDIITEIEECWNVDAF